ncbi:ABC transporter ATP-binding protein [Ureibacillus acetophenoni]|uniref:ABC-2 type transport system ATP-binding protein n=1 Tax=Ureibacillus acetophenoni TaxID=614649 RepID=A0A285UP91_9BACL|nr:ABC transporter ATP-binding protein [Ureibacillus acetophenoni]SOC43218.1 ABC-2 type transport system ATP-binding protein [Ureibacillus acetophenoni]
MKIQVSNVTKKYKDKVALNNVSFTIEGPKIVGFLGHNGAGKTTFLNMLSGILPTTNGELRVNGMHVFNTATVLRDICFVAETGNFQMEMTVDQSLKANRYFYPNWDEELARKLLKVFALPPKAKVKSLSKGMSSALGIITGLASRAPITIFDEPYIGLDVAGRSKFYDLLIEEQEIDPRLFILSTHLIDEVSNLFDEVLILNEGELLLQKDYLEWDETILAIRGSSEEVANAAIGHEVIYEQTFMNEKMAVLYLKNPVLNEEVKAERVSLQDLLVYLSKQQKEGYAL